jgi:lysophospholipase L1-like esterase
MIKQNMTILFQGDSITDTGRNRELQDTPNEGMGRGYAYMTMARLLADHPAENLRFFNRGISGNRIVDLYARWKIDALNLRPDVLSILIGVNDTWHGFNNNNGVEPERYERFYREILDWTRKELPETRLILCEPFILPGTAVNSENSAWYDEMAERGAIVKRLAAEFDCAFIPFQTLFNEAVKTAPPEYWLEDGVHPTPAGHQRMSDLWLKTFNSL